VAGLARTFDVAGLARTFDVAGLARTFDVAPGSPRTFDVAKTPIPNPGSAYVARVRSASIDEVRNGASSRVNELKG
jgi:hypothetical protein